MCSLYRLLVAKNHNVGQILSFWRLLYRPHFSGEGQISYAIADPRYTLTCQSSSRSVYSVALWRRKKTQFLPFFALRHLVVSPVANWQQSEKVDHGCTTTNLLLSNGIKIVSVLQRLHGEVGRTVSDVQKRYEQTHKQTDRQKNNVFGRPGGG